MKSFTKLAILIWVVFFFSSCHNKAVDYNNALVNIQQQVLPKVREFAKKWSSNVDSSNLHYILPEATGIVKILNQKISEVKSLPIVPGGENLRDAIVEQLEFQKNLCLKLGSLGDSAVTLEEKASIEEGFDKTPAEVDRITRRVNETQKEFAEKNHFTLQNK